MSSAQIILLPVFRRTWVFACKTHEATPSAANHIDSSLSGRIKQWVSGVGNWVSASLARQWQKAEHAKDGSLLNYSYRFGQWAISREHPDETFLRAVPPDASRMEVIFPASINERFVRRRLRLLIRGRINEHRVWAMIWAAITLPVLPLIVSPLPNLPVYYGGYKAWAHYRAWRGAQSLQGLVVNIDRKQLCNLRAQLLDMQRTADCQFEEGTWPYDLLAHSGRYKGVLNAPSQPDGAPCSNIGLVATLQGSPKLDEILTPSMRWDHPVDDDAIIEAATAFHFPSREVLAHVRRARNQALEGAGH